jgi:hypothetical protein
VRSALRGNALPPPRPGEQTVWAEALEDWWWLDRHRLTPDQVQDMPAASIERIRVITIEAEKIRREREPGE